MTDSLSTYSYYYSSLRRKGLTLEELADLLLAHGAIYAINMDGGGSSTMVMSPPPSSSESKDKDKDTLESSNTTATNTNDNSNGNHDYAVINHPTCLDLPFPHCQRPVATVLCVSSNEMV